MGGYGGVLGEGVCLIFYGQTDLKSHIVFFKSYISKCLDKIKYNLNTSFESGIEPLPNENKVSKGKCIKN